MSVSDNYVPIRVLGNGSTDEFAASWKVFNSSYLIVDFEDASDPTDITPQVLGSDYTLSFNDSGFIVTFVTPPPNTVYVRIYRSIELTQTDPYTTAKGFQGDVIEASFDKLTSIAQDQQDFIDRGIYAPLGTTLATNTILGTLNSTNKVLALSTNGPAVIDVDADDLESLIAIEADISTVAGIAADVTTVAGIDTEVTTVAGISADVQTVAGIAADVTAVAGNETDISAVASISADVSTVAGIAADVTAAANNIPKANRTAIVAPTVNDDQTQGYSEGSMWVDTVANTVYFCTNPATGAAVWETATLEDGSVTYAKIQNIDSMTLIGRTAAGSGVSSAVALIDDDTFATATSTNVPSAESVKAYVDGKSVKAARLVYEVAQNTVAPTYTSGGWRTGLINTEEYDPDGIVSLDSNQFTLQAGLYRITGMIYSKNAQGSHQMRQRIYNITDSSVAFVGMNTLINSDLPSVNTAIDGFVEITAAKTFEIQIYNTGNTTNANSAVNVSGENELYTFVNIQKLR